MKTEFKLKQIFIYPVKSLAGIEVNQWQAAKTGLLYDRKWMLIDEQGLFLSQRRLPQMALIKTALTAQELILSAPGMSNICVPLQENDGEEIASQVWDDNCLARSVSKEVDQWLSEFLKMSCRLVYLPDETIRTVDPDYAQPTDRTAFSDGFPFLIVSEASLLALNQAMGQNFSMLRFRPNLVISGCDSYAEDKWREIRIGEINFRLPKPCSRCSVPAINPETAEIGKEPLTTLNQLRKWQNKIYFGQNALHDNGGILTVGDAVAILQEGQAQPPL